MSRIFNRARVAGLLGLAALLILPAVVQAHEHREVGDYTFTVGWIGEPALVGQPNQLSIRIETAAEAEEHEHEETSGASTGGIDVSEHGAFFLEALDPGETLAFTVPEELMGLDLPFHDHADHTMTGMIMVRHDAPEAASVMIHNTGTAFQPAMVTVRPGAEVHFINDSSAVRSVVSGMIDEAASAEAAGEDHDHAAMAGVEGLSLQVEVTHVETGESRVVVLRDAFGDPGLYVADMIPTLAGVYSFRVFSEIDGEAIDETFESGPNTFSSIETVADLQFPVVVPEAREIEGAVRGAQGAANDALGAAIDAENSASSARTLAVVGIVLGAFGIAFGAGSTAAVLRRR